MSKHLIFSLTGSDAEVVGRLVWEDTVYSLMILIAVQYDDVLYTAVQYCTLTEERKQWGGDE